MTEQMDQYQEADWEAERDERAFITRAKVRHVAHLRLAAELIEGVLAAYTVTRSEVDRHKLSIHLAEGELPDAVRELWGDEALIAEVHPSRMAQARGTLNGYAVDLCGRLP